MVTFRKHDGTGWGDIAASRWDGAAWAVISGTASTVAKFVLRTLAETVNAPLMTTPPTFTFSGPLDTATYTQSLTGTITRVPWDSASLTKAGLLPVTMDTTNGQSVVNGSGMSNGTSTTLAQPWTLRFRHTGQVFAIRLTKHHNSGPPRMKVTVNGERAHDAALSYTTPTSEGYTYFVDVDFGSAATRDVVIEFAGARVYGLDIIQGDTLEALPLSTPTLTVLGDSWVEGTLEAGDTRLDAMGWVTGRLLSSPAHVMGWGGTGYVNGNGATPPRNYAATDRYTDLVSIAPDWLVVFGSINDNGATATDIEAGAAALYSKIATDLPNTKVIVVGSQSYNNASNTGAANVANRDAVKRAALAASNVVEFVDPMAETWVTGTGDSVTPKGDGNADQYHNGNNLNHLTKAGNYYYAERLAGRIAAHTP